MAAAPAKIASSSAAPQHGDNTRTNRAQELLADLREKRESFVLRTSSSQQLELARQFCDAAGADTQLNGGLASLGASPDHEVAGSRGRKRRNLESTNKKRSAAEIRQEMREERSKLIDRMNSSDPGMACCLPPKRLAQTKSSTSSRSNNASQRLKIGEVIGSGAYGTVHLGSFADDEEKNLVVCKRAWTRAELTDAKDPVDMEGLCQFYFKAEKHCFEKMEACPMVSNYVGTYQDVSRGFQWMTFNLISSSNSAQPAPTLAKVMAGSISEKNGKHHLSGLQDALGMKALSTLNETLDTVLLSILRGLAYIHAQRIVHRDIKPDNLLCDAKTQSMVVIDFGSAADMDPVKSLFGKKRMGLEYENSIAFSPIYKAPEVFIRPERNPFQFDVFGVALIFCQLLFNSQDVRVEEGLHLEFEAVDWNLDSWLSRQLLNNLRTTEIQIALDYVTKRPGMWGLLKKMLHKNPTIRLSSAEALFEAKRCITGKSAADDGPFFESVMALQAQEKKQKDLVTKLRALRFTAPIASEQPMGLVLAEASDEFKGKRQDRDKWNMATKDAPAGAVFVQSIENNKQAHKLGTIEVGDQLQGVGDTALMNKGLEEANSMIQNESAKTVILQFSRKSMLTVGHQESRVSTNKVMLADVGSWSVQGKRKNQEDNLSAHDIDVDGTTVMLTGVYDGHAGSSASTTISRLLPNLYAENLRKSTMTKRQALELAWVTTCNAYRDGCGDGECVADYDTRKGITVSKVDPEGKVAGSTATAIAFEGNGISILNCGDCRALLIGSDGRVVFATEDHSPENEMDRLRRGKSRGLNYSIPENYLTRWYLQVGEMEYSVGRSLEGPFATSIGVVSDPEINSIRGAPGGILVVASDGLFGVVDNEIVAESVMTARKDGLSATMAASKLCTLALDKNTRDNTTAAVVFLQ